MVGRRAVATGMKTESWINLGLSGTLQNAMLEPRSEVQRRSCITLLSWIDPEKVLWKKFRIFLLQLDSWASFVLFFTLFEIPFVADQSQSRTIRHAINWMKISHLINQYDTVWIPVPENDLSFLSRH